MQAKYFIEKKEKPVYLIYVPAENLLFNMSAQMGFQPDFQIPENAFDIRINDNIIKKILKYIQLDKKVNEIIDREFKKTKDNWIYVKQNKMLLGRGYKISFGEPVKKLKYTEVKFRKNTIDCIERYVELDKTINETIRNIFKEI